MEKAAGRLSDNSSRSTSWKAERRRALWSTMDNYGGEHYPERASLPAERGSASHHNPTACRQRVIVQLAQEAYF